MTKTEMLEFDAFSVSVIRTKRRTLTLEIGVDGVKARAPLRMSLKAITQFIDKKSNWIEKHLDRRPVGQVPIELQDNAVILYQGKEHLLRIIEGKRGQGFIDEARLHLPVIRSHIPLSTSIKTKLVKFYKQAAQNTLEERVDLFAELMDVERSKQQLLSPNSVKVRDYKRRWGSCDHLGKLSFNWRIIQAPPEVLDYVVVHELAHCHEFNHSKRFWRIVERQMPDWKERQAWLHQHGSELYRI